MPTVTLLDLTKSKKLKVVHSLPLRFTKPWLKT
jgi:hypothetical protein